MRATRQLQTAFTAGELDPRLAARLEVTKYYSGASLMRNVLVLPQGGFRRRPGMRHCATASGGLDGCRLIPFAFNAEQTYAILLTAGSLTVFLPDGTQVWTTTGCVWNAAQAAQMNYTQSADTLLLFQPSMPPQRLRRMGSDSSWAVDSFVMVNLPTFDFGAGQEPVISNTRGWPECATFHGNRLYMGGLASRPSTIIASKVGDLFNFDRGTALDDEGFMTTIDSDQVNAIRQLRSGKALQIFTGGAEYAITVAPPITPTNLAIEEQTRRGIKRYANVVEVDGATLFVQAGGAGLRQFVYSDITAQYQADLLSLLAPHLIVDPVQLAIRKGAAQDDADHVLIVRGDGQITVLTTLRSQEVVAFTRWETSGSVKSACALLSGQVFFAVVRNGTLRIETWDDTCRLDAATRVTGTGLTSIAGLTHLVGLDTGLLTDGAWQGTAPLGSATLTLPRAADSAEAGLYFEPEVATMPVEPRDQTGALIGRKCRIVNQACRVLNTGTFAMDDAAVILRSPAEGAPVLGTAPPVFTGDVKVRGRLGWAYQQQTRITQPVPGPLTVLALSCDLSLAG